MKLSQTDDLEGDKKETQNYRKKEKDNVTL